METHYHIHYGDADELEDDDEIALALPPKATLQIVLDEVVEFLEAQKSLLRAEQVVDLTAYRNLKEYLRLLANMGDDHTDIIETVGLELEIEEGLSVSIVPCDFAH